MWWVGFGSFVLVVLGLAIAFYFIQVKNENRLDKFDQSKQRLEKMSEEFELLLYLAKENTQVFERMKEIKDLILFENPSQKKEVETYDEKIKSHISDLKIALAKAKDRGTYSSANRIISQIEVLLLERRQKEK